MTGRERAGVVLVATVLTAYGVVAALAVAYVVGIGWKAVAVAVAAFLAARYIAPALDRRARAAEARWLAEDLDALGRCVHRPQQVEPDPGCTRGQGPHEPGREPPGSTPAS